MYNSLLNKDFLIFFNKNSFKNNNTCMCIIYAHTQIKILFISLSISIFFNIKKYSQFI